MSTEAQKRASKKYYEKHKDYYKQKAMDEVKKVRQERNELKELLRQLTEQKVNNNE